MVAFGRDRREIDDEEEETLGRFLLDVLINSAIIIGMYLFLQQFIAAPFQVVGHSMDMTLHDGEYIVVSKLEYLIGNPERGDIIVFHPPQHTKDYYIKRIVGIPGDQIGLRAGKLFVNGKEIKEPYLPDSVKTCIIGYLQDCQNDDQVYTVPENKFFVLGDNRTGSSDSRAWIGEDNKPDPFVDRKQVQGKTRVVLWPPFQIRMIPVTSAFR